MLLMLVPLENISLICRDHHCRRIDSKLNARHPWPLIREGSLSTTPAVTRALRFYFQVLCLYNGPPFTISKGYFIFVWGLSSHSRMFYFLGDLPLPVKSYKCDICWAFMVIKLWDFFSVPHLAIFREGKISLRFAAQIHHLQRISMARTRNFQRSCINCFCLRL